MPLLDYKLSNILNILDNIRSNTYDISYIVMILYMLMLAYIINNYSVEKETI